jgi:hypothetical protein
MKPFRTAPFSRQELINEARRLHRLADMAIGRAAEGSYERARLTYEADAVQMIVAVLEHCVEADVKEIPPAPAKPADDLEFE